ncbi:MAG: hypothetical protein VX223_16005 [Myxococcota bacterium]|nr:hypothetical protein [Myxococcota bacterium]
MNMMLSVVVLLVHAPPIPESKKECHDSLDVAIFTSPRRAQTRQTLSVIIASEHDFPQAAVSAKKPDGTIVEVPSWRSSGEPYGWVARLDSPDHGRWRFVLASGNEIHACQTVYVRKRTGRAAKVTPEEDPVWDSRLRWERDTENLFSIWVEYLFDVPVTEEPTWRPLHVVLRQPERNFLHNHWNLREDTPKGLRLRPDCADFPYFLRGYFAWKWRLPFAFRPCRRGTIRRAPTCGDLVTNLLPATTDLRVTSFEHFIRRECGGRVHSSSGRTLPNAEKSDYYPVELTRRALRPGTIFADPYGHVLVITKWVQQTDERPGILFAVDAQPDATIGRRRFWRGSFLFAEKDAIPGAGFKRFRPVYRRRRGDDLSIRAYSNSWITKNENYGDFSTAQWDAGPDAFYERMDALINPKPMPPKVFFRAALDALTEQVRRRVKSVDAGEQWKEKYPNRVIKMPEGAAIFQTSGPWEGFATPSRDLRLLIAIQTVIDYPKRVVQFPNRFIIPAGESPKAARDRLIGELMAEAAQRTFIYTRSDGSQQTLTIADIINRRTALEMAYNPNDCPEIRWGAMPDSVEFAPCKARRPQEHTDAMTSYRTWFRNRRRPVR